MTHSLKAWLIGLTAIAVISDSMLIPFYPQFFASVFGVTSPTQVGLYIAACCLTVMLAFPLWARVVRHGQLLPLLIRTQLLAGAFSVLCYWAPSLGLFWLASLTMLAFKASYLLIYPQIMRLEQLESHGRTIGLLSVIVHFGGIVGALLGGAVLQWFEPRQVFLLMALGDVLQTGLCMALQRRHALIAEAPGPAAEAPPADPRGPGRVVRLCIVMVVFYFSTFLIRPFFVRYWESRSAFSDELVAGLVFAIPGGVALFALWLSYMRPARADAPWRLMPAMLCAITGLLLQGADDSSVILAGRLLFGWGLFRASVRLDQLLFALSHPPAYATDFSKVSFSQNLGVLVASWAAGAVVAAFSLNTPFFLAAGGLLVSAVLFHVLLIRPQRYSHVASYSRSPLSRSEA